MRPRWAHAFGSPLGIIVGVGDRADARLTGRYTGVTAFRSHQHGRSWRARYLKLGRTVLVFANQRNQLSDLPNDHPDYNESWRP